MFILDGAVVTSATDVALASTCELALLRLLDARLGRSDPPPRDADAMMRRVAALGDVHEHGVLEVLRARFGPYDPTAGRGVLELPDAGAYDLAGLRAAHHRTLEALRSGTDAVYQGTFFDGTFYGRADFLVRVDGRQGRADGGWRAPGGGGGGRTGGAGTEQADDGRVERADGGGRTAGAGVSYAVHDAKLARHAKIPALLQLAAYAEQMQRAGIGVDAAGVLVLGDGHESRHELEDIVPVFRERRARLDALITAHLDAGPVTWGQEGVLACGRCETCAAEVAAHRDVLLVAGLRTTQRARLHAAGITTVEELAASTGPVSGIGTATLAGLRDQARLQSEQDSSPRGPDGAPLVRAEVVAPEVLAALPAPDPGDIYFDFEGDPLWSADGSDEWGLEYLFGVVEAGPAADFRAFWAHDRAEERAALEDFLAYVTARREAHPGMHVYHYAPYEKTALRRLVGRHGVGEEVLDDLLRHGVLVDLYATVRQGIRVSQPSYSIKKLEPLYMGTEARTGLDNAADSIVAYAEATAARERGDVAAYRDQLASIEAYNAYDCLSTYRLHEWLLAQGRAHGVEPASAAPVTPEEEPEPHPLERALLAAAGPGTRAERTPEEQAHALLAAALGYHRREDKPFWWEHFDRLSADVEEWRENRDVLVARSVTPQREWFKEGKQRNLRRHLRMSGALPTGSTIRVGAGGFLLYGGPPYPRDLEPGPGEVRVAHSSAKVLARSEEDAGDVLVVEETIPAALQPYDALPMAVTPGAPPQTKNLVSAIEEVAQQVLDAGPDPQPALDVLCRRPPRLVGLAALPAPGTDGGYVEAITDAVRALDRSYLAVQGPPGTGKTYVGARVIAALVGEGWRVGVVAQSHAVVENLLDRVVDAGVPRERVGKKYEGDQPCAWTPLPTDGHAAFLGGHGPLGCVVGGTAWDFTNTKRVGRQDLDLLVVDEAGQFSLAATIAVSAATKRLLLLGDPQQLPQVSQGTHPEPVDDSALGWLAEGHETLPPERGYFLERTWRMHPALCERVSRLAYSGRLRSMETVTTNRRLTGVEPGVRTVRLAHTGNATVSEEEAAEVVAQVQAVVERGWTDDVAGGVPPRPLGEGGVLVVAAYNAQVALIRRRLAEAGLDEVRVGTVDKFQGQQAPVVVVSMAASAVEDVPRGMSFLLSRNRVNVAVSRAQWAAVLVRSEALTDYLPGTPTGLAELGAFIALSDGA
ncbi:TM0106 family RecB-like putative nuclease [Georgenia wangjunii]|uniref:TM0106 family RecB-like putative nuclease n=1 Tax=Georgenia wangjunii TaxID=3117730 RepID=UPI002F26A3FA